MNRQADQIRREEEQRQRRNEMSKKRAAETSKEFNELRQLLPIPEENARKLSQLEVLRQTRDHVEMLAHVNQQYQNRYGPYRSPTASPHTSPSASPLRSSSSSDQDYVQHPSREVGELQNNSSGQRRLESSPTEVSDLLGPFSGLGLGAGGGAHGNRGRNQDPLQGSQCGLRLPSNPPMSNEGQIGKYSGEGGFVRSYHQN